MTRQEEIDRRVIGNCAGLRFLVLDELHTYRGRQGADVALLVRRVRERRQRLDFWAALALLRCAGSSPAAAVLALRTRAGEDLGPEAREDLLDRIFDGDGEALVADDVEPPAGGDGPALARLVALAESVAGRKGDPKLEAAARHTKELGEAGYNVVVFCRFIATAHYVARHLRDHLGASRSASSPARCPRGARGAGGAARGERGRPGPGRHRLPVGGRQPAGALRRRRPLRPVLEPDAPRAARGPGRPLRPAEPHGARHAPLRRAPGGRRGASGHSAQGGPHPGGARRPRAGSGRGPLARAGPAQGGAPAPGRPLRRRRGPADRAVRAPLGGREDEGEEEPDGVRPAAHPARRGPARVAPEPRRGRGA